MSAAIPGTSDYQNRLLDMFLQQREQLEKAQTQGPEAVQRLSFDTGRLNDDEKKEIRDLQKKFVLEQARAQSLDSEMQSFQKNEAVRDEKNAYSSNAMIRNISIQPTRSAHIVERLREDDISYVRNTDTPNFKKLKSRVKDLRDFKDKQYEERVDRILYEAKELQLYDKFINLQKEAKNRAQRIAALEKYVEAKLRASHYVNPRVDIPPLFKVNRTDMDMLYKFKSDTFRKGNLNSTAGISVSIAVVFQALFSILGVYLLEKSKRKDSAYKVGRTAATAVAVVFFQLLFYKRSFSNLSTPGKGGFVLGAAGGIVLSFYVSFVMRTSKDVIDQRDYQNARYCILASFMFLFISLAATSRALILISFKENDKTTVSRGGLFAFALAAVLTILLMAPMLHESDERCSSIERSKCMNSLTPESLSNIIEKNAYKGQNRIEGCIENMTTSDHLLVGAFNNINITEE